MCVHLAGLPDTWAWALWEMSQCWVDTLCPQVSILGDQEGRQEGHVGDGEGHLTEWVTDLHSFSR